jgi:dolichol-phosphate mannosyltransferase
MVSKRLSVIVPCYNEEQSLPHFMTDFQMIFEELNRNYDVELIFVDDGSTDNTPILLENLKKEFGYLKVHTHNRNKNLGAAIKTGFSECTGEIIVTTDCDGTYPPSKIIEILYLLDQGTDMVIASPYHPEGKTHGVPAYRRFLSESISSLYSIFFPQKIYTYTALFRACRRQLLDQIKIKSDDFLAVTEWTIFALQKNFVIKEYPTTLFVRKYGVSKMRTASVILSHLKLLSYLVFKSHDRPKI